MKRRHILTSLAAGIAVVALPSLATELPTVEVFKSPTCACCTAWIDHLKASGFTVKVDEVADPAATRRKFGLPDKFGSCHTGIVNGYVLEGHVPAADVKRLLATKPKAVGLAVPGMPVGSPGMEYGDRSDAFDVLLVDKSGRATVFTKYCKN
jgi:hypothetical protein